MQRAMFSVLFAGLWSLLFLPGMGYGHVSETELAATGTLISWMDMSEAEGTTITVTTYIDELTVNGDCSLREAIQAANTDGVVDSCPAGQGVDTILLSSGVYMLALTGRSEDDNVTGDLDIRSSLVISGAGVANTTINANQIDRALHIFTGTVVSIQGLLIRNGRTADGSPSGCGESGDDACDGEPGGGIYNSGRLTIADTDIVGNLTGDGGSSLSGYSGSGGNGGGIANADGELFLDRSVVADNTTGWGGPPNNPYSGACCGGNGGGIHNTGVFSVTDSTISRNRASNSGDGGGLLNRNQGTLLNSILTDNGADGGGGAIANHGDLLLTFSVVSGNRTYDGSYGVRIGLPAGSGGGIFNTAILTVENSTVSNNRAGDGGDGQYWGGAGGSGGGILNTGRLWLENATLAHNRTGVAGSACPPYCGSSKPPDGHGGAIANEGTVSLQNTILSSNYTIGDGPVCWGVFVSTGYNLIQNTTDCTLGGDSTGNMLDRYAWLGPLADNGGPTATHALYPQSPALNAGSCIDSNGASVVVDQRGEPRPQGLGCDIGAFESGLTYVPPLTVHMPLIGNSKE